MPQALHRTRVLTALRGLALVPPRFRVRMPGRSHTGPLPPLTAAQHELAQELRRDVDHLVSAHPRRNAFSPRDYAACADALAQALARHIPATTTQTFAESFTGTSTPCTNVIAEIPGSSRPNEVIVCGSHYDSVQLREGPCPAANDNASGVAATLALARRFACARPARTLRFVLFANEEPPFFWTNDMGSLVYAQSCKARRENIVAMITPETIGCYSDAPGYQRYPFPTGFFYPDRGDFITFVSMFEARDTLSRCVNVFRETTPFPSLGAALPACIPHVGASDHWSFWRCGYPALMVTDTAPYRYPHYHTMHDTPEKLNYEHMARVTTGLAHILHDLANN